MAAPAKAPTPRAGRARASAGPLPASVGRFEVLERLGVGAFGAVYRARDPQLDREVALKVLVPEAMANPRQIKRFLLEARSTAKLRHPHIVPVFEAGKDGELYYIVSAYIKGHTLAAAIDEREHDPRYAARVVRQLAEAVAYAHSRGIVHRDVKPPNVMIDERGDAHLMDFGLAASRESISRLTSEGALLGTPSYMAPEQASGQHSEVGPAADQYALGVVLYEMLTSRTPFSGRPEVVLYCAVHSSPLPPRALRVDVPPGLEAVCLKAMAKRPENRYPNCQAMADDLGRWLEGGPVEAAPTRPDEAAGRAEPPGAAVPRLWTALAAFGLTLALLLAVVLIVVRPPQPEPPTPVAVALSPFAVSTSPTWSVEAGGASTVKVQVRRGGRQGAVSLALEGLPAGVTATTDPIPEVAEEGTIRLTARRSAVAVNRPIRVVVRLGEEAATAQPRLDVTPVAGVHLHHAPALSTGPGLDARLAIRLRRFGVEGEVRLGLEGLPAGVSCSPVAVPTKAEQGLLLLTVGDRVVPGQYSVRVHADVAGRLTAVGHLELRVAASPSLELTHDRSLVAGAGKVACLGAQVIRRGFQGGARLEVQGLPAEVTAEPAEMPEDVERGLVRLVVGANVKPGDYLLRVVASHGSVSATSPFVLRVRPELWIRRYPEPGKEMRVKTTHDIIRVAKGAIDSRPFTTKTTSNLTEEFTVAVLDGGGDPPTRFRRTYTRARQTTGGQGRALSYEGKTIVFQLSGGKYVGRPERPSDVKPEDVAIAVDKVNEDELNWVFLPNRLPKPGAGWAVGAEKVRDSYARYEGAELSRVEMKGTLLKLQPQPGRGEVGFFRLELQAGLKKWRGPAFIAPANAKVRWMVEAATDGSSTAASVSLDGTVSGHAFVTESGQKVKVSLQYTIRQRELRQAEQ